MNADDKKAAEAAILNLREIFAKVDDYEREELHARLMEGYCKTCGHAFAGMCSNCYDSRCDMD